MRGLVRYTCAYGAIAIALAATPATAQKAKPKEPAAKTRANTRSNTVKPTEAPASQADTGTAPAASTAPVTAGAAVTNDGTASDVVVIGIRGSIESAIARKRRNSQIVDSVVSEDAGKLPDNNVAEAVSRIPGVNISRGQGQGGAITIRGLAGVQTTVNGQDVAVGENRGLNLSDVPAELIKAIDVYKTRSASQPEGGIGGTVNVELRRPLELKKGLLVAGSVRGLYNDLTDKASPFVSLLASYRFDTGLGEMGILLNGSYTKTFWSETVIGSESPSTLSDVPRASLPAAIRDRAIAPYRITYNLNSGVRTQPAFSGTWQWRTSDKLNFVVEGQYFGSQTDDRFQGIDLLTREGNFTLSNVVLGPSGAISSATYTDPGPVRSSTGRVIAGLPTSVYSTNFRGKSDTLIGNVEAHWASGIARIDVSGQYQHFRGSSYGAGTNAAYAQATVANVDFNTPLVEGGVPTFSLVGIDFANPAQATLRGFSDNLTRNRSDIFIAQADTNLDVSTDKLLRQFRFGARYSNRVEFRSYGYRNARWDNPEIRPSIEALDAPIDRVTPSINGVAPITFAAIDPQYVFDKFDTLKVKALALGPDGFDGNGPQTSVADFLAIDRPTIDKLQGARFTEMIFAAYAEAGWALKLGVPVDGLVGLRYVNTYGSNQGARLVLPSNPDGSCCGTPFQVDDSTRGNAADLLPSISAVAHFTPQIQLRGVYNYNVQRPGFYDLRNTLIIENASNPNGPVYAGNPQLQPIRENNYNASLEWFPRGGVSVTAGAFLKNQTGFFYYTQLLQPVAQLGGQIRRVFQVRNAGPGQVYGFEGAINTPFFFLPGFLRNFGVNANVTFIPHAILSVPDINGENFVDVRSPNTSKWTTNLILFYETPQLSARVAYNWRSDFKTGFDTINPGWVQLGYPQQRLDAAINYTPVRFLTLSIEGTNLTRSLDRFRYDLYPDLSVGLRAMARTIQASARFRF